MGLVTNVYWDCPGCGSREQAQIAAEWDDPQEMPSTVISADSYLKWNPPCERCGKFYLHKPEVFVQCVPMPVIKDEP